LNILTLSLFPGLRVLGIIPLTPLFFIIALAFFRKGFEPLLLAALSGVYLDMYSSYPFGLYLVLFSFSVVAVRYMFQEGMRTLSLWYFLIVCMAAYFAYNVTQVVFLLADKVSIGVSAIYPILVGTVVNIICAILVYVSSNWYFDKLDVLADKLKRR
jgi:cell shape-determining protein MreD